MILRWLKFNLVGAVGMVVQLSALAIFNHLAPRHYLAATAAAIELTLIHNFFWHLHYTWADRKTARRSNTSPGTQLLRFHLSNGLVSLIGNLALMRLLVQHAHLPVVLANVIAILCCSAVNFTLSHTWAFATKPAPLEVGAGS